mmetsp:Transcript_24761/g.44631  ORF Transcript_24761/g.44631 Transcript_24761/m.44631 type:complete len:286 (-) Transcript_24761:50-907(-)
MRGSEINAPQRRGGSGSAGAACRAVLQILDSAWIASTAVYLQSNAASSNSEMPSWIRPNAMSSIPIQYPGSQYVDSISRACRKCVYAVRWSFRRRANTPRFSCTLALAAQGPAAAASKRASSFLQSHTRVIVLPAAAAAASRTMMVRRRRRRRRQREGEWKGRDLSRHCTCFDSSFPSLKVASIFFFFFFLLLPRFCFAIPLLPLSLLPLPPSSSSLARRQGTRRRRQHELEHSGGGGPDGVAAAVEVGQNGLGIPNEIHVHRCFRIQKWTESLGGWQRSGGMGG